MVDLIMFVEGVFLGLPLLTLVVLPTTLVSGPGRFSMVSVP